MHISYTQSVDAISALRRSEGYSASLHARARSREHAEISVPVRLIDASALPVFVSAGGHISVFA